jgi:hypothetical protein
VALVLALAVPRSFAPWNTVFAQVADWLPIDRPAPPRPIAARYDARELLPAEGSINRMLLWRLYLFHGMAAPLALVCLLAVGAHKLRKRR